VLAVNVESQTPTRIILDPSFLFSDEALNWLTDLVIHPWLVISEALWNRMEDPGIGEQLAPFGIAPSEYEVRRLRVLVEPLTRFSYRAVESLPEGAQAIRDELLSEDRPISDVLADEWIFLTTQSLAALHVENNSVLEAFRRAGGQVYVVSRTKMIYGLTRIRRLIPPRVLRVMKAIGRWPRKKTPHGSSPVGTLGSPFCHMSGYLLL
jgi:hypothetical protein